LSFIYLFCVSQQDVSPKESNRLVAKRSIFTCEQMTVVSRISSGCLQPLRVGKALILRIFLYCCRKLCGDVRSQLLVLVRDFIFNGNCGFHKAQQFINYSRAIASICGRRPFYTASIVERFVTPNWIGRFGGLFQTDFEPFHFFVSFLVVALQ
jgi:hypothetical protein